jgi:putative hydroxymethylpyrimidine transport system substrate-binding protein
LAAAGAALAGRLVGGAALAAPLRGAQDGQAVSVGLDWYPNANHAGLYLGQARGAFADAGLAVELFTPPDPTTVLSTVGAGRDTFGISYQTDVLLARAEGVPVVSVAALVQHPLQVAMSLAESGIARPADLAGRTVGYPGIPSEEQFLATMLETDGLGLDDIELVNVGFDLIPAVISGRVDAAMGAYWTHETILAERQGYPVATLRVEEWGVPDYYELVLVASEATVVDRPELVTAFLGATQRGYMAAIADQAAALDALLAANPELEREVEAEGLALLAPVWTDGVPAFGTQTAARWETYAGWMVERGLIPADLDVAAAWTADLLPDPSPGGTPAATPGTSPTS